MISRVYPGVGRLLRLGALFLSVAGPARAADAPASSPTKTGGSPLGYEIVRLGRGPGNRLCLAATIAGKKGLMIVDTGASNTVLTDSTYGFLRTQNAGLAHNLPKTVGFNWTRADVAVATDFTVGQKNLGTLPVLLVSRRYLYDPAMPRSGDTDRSYDGLFGEELLRHYGALVDCGRMALYLNTDPARKISSGAAFARAGWTPVPMETVGREFAVPCAINGHRFRLIVDTGAPFTTVSRHLVDSIHLDSRVVNNFRAGVVATRAEEIGLSTVDGMQVGSYTVPRVNMVVNPESFAEFGGKREAAKDQIIAGFLGGDVLAANGAIVDVGNKTLYLRSTGAGQ